MLNRTNLPTFQSVALGGTATCELTLGQLVYAHYLIVGDDGTASVVANTGAVAASGLTQAQIEGVLDRIIGQIRIKLNSKVQRTMMASQLNQLNVLNGSRYGAFYTGTPGTAAFQIYLPIFWAEFWRKNPAEVPALALNLNEKNGPNGSDGKPYGDVDGAQILVDLNANVPVGGQASVNAPFLAGNYLWVPANRNKGVGSINCWITTDLQAVGTKGDFKLDRVKWIQSIHLWPTQEAAPKTVAYFELDASGFAVQDRMSSEDIAAHLYTMELNPDPAGNRLDWVSDMDDPVLNALPAQAQSSLVMKLEYSGAAAGNLPVLIQRIGAPE